MAKQQERVGSLRLSDAYQPEVEVLHSWVVPVCPNFSWAKRLNKSTDTSNTVLVALRQIKKGKALITPGCKASLKNVFAKLRGN